LHNADPEAELQTLVAPGTLTSQQRPPASHLPPARPPARHHPTPASQSRNASQAASHASHATAEHVLCMYLM
jgi:hypothetical protein